MRISKSSVLLQLCELSTLVMSVPTSSYGVNQPSNITKIQGYGDLRLRYREVPSWVCEMTPGVKSYAGYVDISDDVHMFFWFFEARVSDPTKAPLTTWISGGPGDSSMAELFTENGPCRVNPDGETIVNNPFSWNNHSNMLYIDQPVQVGFSYTNLVRAYLSADEDEIVEIDDDDECPDNATICGNFSEPNISKTTNSTPAAAPNFWLTLQAFMNSFPQYTNNGFNMGSESYGGHYIPVFGKYILDQNDRQIPGARHIDLTSILVGNGWFSAALQISSFYEFAFNHGETYDLEPPNSSTKKQVYHALYDKGGALDRLKKCTPNASNKVCRAATDFWGENVETPWLDDSERDDNDVREMDPSPFPNEFYSEYLQLDSVRKAIGAKQTYIELNPTVGAAFESTGDDSRDFGIPEILRDMVRRGIRVTLYAGDADYECNWLGVEAVAEAIGVAGFDRAGYTNINTEDGVVHGQVKQSGPFSFVRVYQAGHATGAFQPLALQTLFARTLNGTDLATGNTWVNPQYRSQGSQKSTYREGNATVQYRSWPDNSTYDYITNQPTLENFQPTWP